VKNLNLNKMKKILSKILIITFLFTLSISCDDFLEVENEGAFIPETVLTNPNGMGQLLNGIYQGFTIRGDWSYRFGMWYYSIPGTDIGYERPGTPGFRQAIDRYSMDGTSNNIPGGKFQGMFTVIGRANQVLAIIPMTNASDALKKESEAEARFLRAYAYFDAARTWGDLPIVTTAPSTVSEALNFGTEGGGRAPVKDVFEQVIIPDLEFATENLPDTERLPGTPTSWAAKAMLAKIYMQAAGQFGLSPTEGGTYWQLAIPLLQDVIVNGPYQLTPGTNYSELYNVDFESTNSEKIWVIKMLRDGNPDGYATFWFAPQNYGDRDEIYLQNPERRAFPVTNSFGGGRQNIQVYKDFYESFDPIDMRRDVAIRDYTFNMTDDDSNLLTGNTRWPWGVNKYNYDAVAYEKNSRDGIDRIMLRLADVYLLLAEAINEVNGPTAEAFSAINVIRKRAGIPELSTGDQIGGHFTYGNGSHSMVTKEGFRFAVLRERAWELCYEYQRRFDLIRQGYLDDCALHRWGIPGTAPDNKNYPPILESFPEGRELFPLPNEQVTLNEWEQNPGY
jgi:hypothetical protein